MISTELKNETLLLFHLAKSYQAPDTCKSLFISERAKWTSCGFSSQGIGSLAGSRTLKHAYPSLGYHVKVRSVVIAIGCGSMKDQKVLFYT